MSTLMTSNLAAFRPRHTLGAGQPAASLSDARSDWMRVLDELSRHVHALSDAHGPAMAAALQVDVAAVDRAGFFLLDMATAYQDQREALAKTQAETVELLDATEQRLASAAAENLQLAERATKPHVEGLYARLKYLEDAVRRNLARSTARQVINTARQRASLAEQQAIVAEQSKVADG